MQSDGAAASPETSVAPSRMTPLVIGAIGVVYGDIGTSPLYTLRQCFTGMHRLDLSAANIMGILSIIFWSLVIVVTLKYVTLIMRADNRGEGGILALTALVSRTLESQPRRRWWFVGFGIFGAAMFYGDGMITPAISVLGAVEGLDIITAQLHPFIDPIAIVIIIALFAIQRSGTARVGMFFGPVMCAWFVTLALLGITQVIDEPRVLAAINPAHAVAFVVANPTAAFLALGAVVLAVTGTEALYADMGHFGKAPDPARVAAVRDAGARPELLRPGRVAARRSGRDQESVLSARADLGFDPVGDPRDLGGRDRVTGGDLRRVLADARRDSDGLLSAAHHQAHVRSGDRSDLRAVRELGAVHRGDPARRRFPSLRQPRRRIRHRRDAGDADRLDPDSVRDATDVELARTRRVRDRGSVDQRSTSRSSPPTH